MTVTSGPGAGKPASDAAIDDERGRELPARAERRDRLGRLVRALAQRVHFADQQQALADEGAVDGGAGAPPGQRFHAAAGVIPPGRGAEVEVKPLRAEGAGRQELGTRARRVASVGARRKGKVRPDAERRPGPALGGEIVEPEGVNPGESPVRLGSAAHRGQRQRDARPARCERCRRKSPVPGCARWSRRRPARTATASRARTPSARSDRRRR